MSLLTTNIAYEGRDINNIIMKSFFETLLHTNWGAKIIQGVKSKYVYHDLDSNIELQPYSNCPGTIQSVTLNQRSRSLCEFRMDLRLEHDALVGTYREAQLAQGTMAEKISDDELLYGLIIEHITSKLAEQWDDIAINGNTYSGSGILALCDGLLQKWQADSAVVDVTAVSGNLVPTGSNSIIGELDKLIDNYDNRLMYSSNPDKMPQIGTSIKIARVYQQYLQRNGFFNFDPTMKTPLVYNGIQIVPLGFLPDNQMFMTPKTNISLIYDDLGDLAELNIIDEFNINACKSLLITMMFRAAVDYGFGEYVTYYH